MTPCQNCPAVHKITSSGFCAAGYRTVTQQQQDRRVRYPATECVRPRNSAELAERIDVLNREMEE
jgi:Holliday junction resolvasome RuvABC endonuclease subunit